MDDNKVQLKHWLSRLDDKYGYLCSSKLKYSSGGKQGFLSYAKTDDHQKLSTAKYSSSQVHIEIGSTGTSTSSVESSTSGSNGNNTIRLDPSLNDKVSAAEAMRMFNVAEEDYSFRSCDNTNQLFGNMFTDSPTAANFTMCRTKASYLISDGIGPLLATEICESISEGAFTLLFDETTTLQTRKQMDILIRYWSEKDNLVVTKYVTSFFFKRAPADTVVDLFVEELMDNENFKIPWDRFCSVSSDGPNINKSIYAQLNAKLKERGRKALLPVQPCALFYFYFYMDYFF